jgi:tRNA U34 2-thiouridine synthase MnmA/TrmU
MFKLPFGEGCCNNLSCNFNFSQIQGVKLEIIDCTKGILFKKYMKILEHPKHGRGSGINPCIDCRIFMFSEAKILMKKFKCQFIATGEVLGERPMSQHKKSMDIIEAESGLKGKVLRPLSAKLFPETPAEKKKLVNRKLLLDIQGRQRHIQIALAKKYNITYPAPAGGCLLCEKTCATKLKDLFEHSTKISFPETASLNGFRHFRAEGKLIVGRRHEENLRLQELNKSLKWEIIVCTPDAPGPTCLYENKKDKKLAEKLVKVYSLNDLKLREEFEKYRI